MDAATLGRMSAALVHRGPDGSGVFVQDEIGLVSRRLRIIDPHEVSDQPMSTADGRFWITFNGEIHNYLELRRQLSSCGARFRTESDTEVVLQAYATWGPDCFERFNGMWALALWDARDRRLVLCRDRFGIKPLYYSMRGDRICFASEPKAILAGFPVEREPDRDEIGRFLAGGYPDAREATFFKNIRVLRPAQYMVLSSTTTRVARYWRFTPGEETARPDSEGTFRELLADAVRLRGRSDVPVGACISGGLDSGTIARLLEPTGGELIHCFSTCYDDPRHDERRYAELATRDRPFTMHWVRPHGRDLLETMRKIVWHHDAPTPIRGRLAQWFVMQEAGRHVKVVVDGQGADELLGGYVHDTLFYLADRIRSRPPARHGGWTGLATEVRQLAQVGRTRLSWYALTAPRRYLRDPRVRRPGPFASQLNNVLWNGLCYDGLPELLHAEDALSMAFSVESRTPFLDHRLVEFCFSLPYDEKIADGWTKSLLRRSMAGVLPPEILARRAKYGFSSPVVGWMQQAETWRAIRELLLDRRALDRGVQHPRRVAAQLKAFEFGPRALVPSAAIRLWRWITLELWFRDFVDSVSTAPARAPLPGAPIAAA